MIKRILPVVAFFLASAQVYAACSSPPTSANTDLAVQFKTISGSVNWGGVSNVANTNEGVVVYDDTNDTLVVCDGTNWVELGGSGGSSVWSVSGTGVYYNSGNVGIGTANPGGKLHVNGGYMYSSGAAADYKGLEFRNNDTGKFWQLLMRGSADTNNYDDLMIHHYDGSSWTAPVTIKQSGNVGFNITDPIALIDASPGGTIRGGMVYLDDHDGTFGKMARLYNYNESFGISREAAGIGGYEASLLQVDLNTAESKFFGNINAQDNNLVMGTGTNRLSLEQQSGFYRLAFKDLRLWDDDSDGDLISINNDAGGGISGMRFTNGASGGYSGLLIDGVTSTKTFGLHYGGDSTNEVRFGRYADDFGSWEASPFRFDLDAPSNSFIFGEDGSLAMGSGRFIGSGGLPASQGMATSTSSLGAMEVKSNGSGGTAGAAFMAFHRPGNFATYFGIDTDSQLKVGGWSMGANAYKLWHEGNDGSGSGLDADLFDGNDSSAFMRTNINTWSTSAEGQSRFYFASGGRTYLEAGNNGDGIILTIRDSSDTDKFHFAHDGNLYIGILGNWITGFLNQAVRTDNAPSFTGLTLNYASPSVDQGFSSFMNGSTEVGVSLAHGGHVTRINQGSTGYCDVRSNVQCASDARLKTVMSGVDNALDKITSLNGVVYKWNQDSGWETVKPHLGLLAQEIACKGGKVKTRGDGTYVIGSDGLLECDEGRLFPEAVSEVESTQKDEKGNSKKRLTASYDVLVAPLIEAVKELKADNDDLRSLIEKQQQEIDALKTSMNR